MNQWTQLTLTRRGPSFLVRTHWPTVVAETPATAAALRWVVTRWSWSGKVAPPCTRKEYELSDLRCGFNERSRRSGGCGRAWCRGNSKFSPSAETASPHVKKGADSGEVPDSSEEGA